MTRRTRATTPSAWQLSKTDTKVASEVIINLNSCHYLRDSHGVIARESLGEMGFCKFV